MTIGTRPTPAYQRFTPHTGSGSFAIVEPGISDAAGRRLRAAALLVVAVCICGIFACDYLIASGIAPDGPASGTSHLRFYALNEPPFLWLLGGIAALVWLLARGGGSVGAPLQKRSAKSLAVPALLAAAAVTVVAAAVTVRVTHSTLSAAALVNPFLAAMSILCLAGASARLWPGDVRRGRLALLYLATSTQFLLASMTPQAWVVQLSLNLLWLYLVLRDDRSGLATAPWVGVAALGLQNPLAHVLVATPFLLRVVRARRGGWIAYYGAVYGAAALASYRWTSFTHTEATPGAPFASLAVAGAARYFAGGIDLSAFLTWQAPAMALFLVAAALLVRSLKPAERDLLAGLVLTFAFYFVFHETGGDDRGYRHLYPVLGSAALLAASATVRVAAQRGGALVPRLVVASTAVALLVQLPLRVVQAQRATRPRVTVPRAPDAPTSVQPTAKPTRGPRRR